MDVEEWIKLGGVVETVTEPPRRTHVMMGRKHRAEQKQPTKSNWRELPALIERKYKP